MIYRGVYRDGVVTLTGHVDLPEGSVVEVLPKHAAPSSKKPASKRKPVKAAKGGTAGKPAKRLSRAERVSAALAVMGDWKDRPDFKGRSTLDIARELRSRARKL